MKNHFNAVSVNNVFCIVHLASLPLAGERPFQCWQCVKKLVKKFVTPVKKKYTSHNIYHIFIAENHLEKSLFVIWRFLNLSFVITATRLLTIWNPTALTVMSNNSAPDAGVGGTRPGTVHIPLTALTARVDIRPTHGFALCIVINSGHSSKRLWINSGI